MPRRQIDIQFDVAEVLSHRVEKDQVRFDGDQLVVRANRLSIGRLPFSVCRKKFAIPVPAGKLNGFAEITAGEAANITKGNIQTVCVDDPKDGNEGHALIAFVCEPGKVASMEELKAARDKLAEKLVIHQINAPT